MAAHQAPRSLGFFRQEYWSGLPFPSPMHEREKWKWSRSVVSNSQRPNGLQPTGSSVHGIFQARVLEWGAIAFSTMEYYSAIKRNTFESVLMRWMNLEPIIQSEISQKEKDKYCICNLKRWYWWIYFQGNSGKTDIENRPMDMGEGEEGEDEMYRESNLEVYVK